MATKSYHKAISLLEADGRLNKRRFPQGDEAIDRLEHVLQVKLPPSYKAMLRDFGILLYRGGEIIYGIGLDGVEGEGGAGVWFQTEMARARKQITSSMVRIQSSGYGPEFCIDCSKVNANGESPVLLVPADGNMENAELVAESFGNFLLVEVEEIIDDSEE